MSKKKNKKQRAADFDSNEEEFGDPQVESMILAEPGWSAVFAACSGCGSPQEDHPVVMWALFRWDDGDSRIIGMCQREFGGFFAAGTPHNFIGYVKPGEKPEDLLERFASSNGHHY